MAYSLATSYAGDALINGFNWIDTRDLSNGYVRYQSQANAASQGLFAVDKHTGVVRIGVDHTNTLDVSDGRPSIRLESKEAYNQGLFVADFLHMPPSQCGVWPAFWAYGPNWPNSGEIDIIEGANTAHRNIISAHTTASCSLGDDVLRMASGAAQTKDCNVGADNVGCGYVTPTSDTSSYGDTFNAVGGGIYAMLWDDEYIKVWHFDRDTAPADIAAKKPEPASWGKPAAVYGGKSCDVESHFRDMSIVLNINFCGDYGNAVWKSDGCSALAPTCSEWVAKNPAAFANAYWDVNYIDAYVQSASNTSTTSSVSFSNFTSSTVSSQSQPSSIPITSLSSTPPSGSNNGTMTRFPAANSSSSSAPTSLVVSSSVPSVSGPSNSSSFITNISTRFSSSSPIVLATQGPIPTASLPSPSGPLRANPANLNDFSYLGCFGSSSDFKSFTKVADSPDMNLNKCTVLCNGKKYAGVFETACYCASELDADTRVSTDACDMPCPGDSTQLCGGRAKPRGNSIDGSIGAKANVTLPQTTAFISGVAMPISTGGGGGGAGGRLAGSGGSSSSGAYASGSYFNSTGPEAPNTFSSSAWNIVTDPKAAYGSSTPTSTIIGAATTRNKTTLQTLPTGSGSSASNPSVVVPSSVNFSPSGSPATDGHGAWINSTSPETPTPASISSQTGTAPVIRTSSRIGTAPVVSISSRSSAAPPIIGTAPPVIGTAPTVSVVTIPVYPLPKVTNSILSSSSRSSGSSSSSSSSSTASSAAVSGSAPAPIGNSTLVIRRRYSPVRRSTPKHVRPAHVDRREASDMLLTVYAAIAQEEPPKQPPGMGANSDLSTQPSSTDTPAAQQSSGASIPAQQSSGAGIPAQQSSSAGAAAQQSISMGIPAQQSSGASIPAQQSSGAGIPAQQSSSAGTPTQQQSSGGSSPGQQSSSAGYPAPQSSGGSSPGQQAPGTGVTSIPNSPAQQSNGNAAAIQTPSTVTSTTTTVVTTVTYQTVYPSNPSKIVNKVFVTTIIKAHCGCPETPLPTMTVSMTTTVLSCAACGPGGANYVTVTVPCDESEATPTAAAELPPAPNSNGNVPPANKNLTPPNGDSVPPTSGGNKPPTPGSNKPPTSNGSVPPGSNGSVPPGPNGSNGSVPPGSNGSVPPGPNGSNGSVPPGPNGNVPPGPNGSNGSVPPGSNGSVPPGSNGSVPPGSNGSVPPAFNDSVPPTSGGNVPTSANNDKPSISNGNARPSADSDKPPASNGNKTPSANNDKPPASNGNAPPSADSDKPPASNGNKTPSANNDKPPASNGNVPPAPNSGKPPAANSNKTPSSSSSVPPAVSGNKPAAPSSNVPTVAGASGFKVTSLLFTTMLAMVVLL
ncbi:Endo-1,3(4)-beta-glucanase [Beauveria bassiana]|uniref:Endo-1,3(4)-beta-glucanase n=1 Tax=Beauveria bassiana TaxID=176275 RepID=A0A2N6NV69_BEABA|nr:Endo-1,3(4)-beta-glucanase [Beauveria bassiana]